MAEDETEALRRAQLERELGEAQQARHARDEDELAAHERRADKARYLREKLEERAAAERDVRSDPSE